MGTKSLIINIGNASKRYSIFEDLEQIAFFNFEKQTGKPVLTIGSSGVFDKSNLFESDYKNSLSYLLNYSEENLGIGIDDVFVVGFRVFGKHDLFLNHKEIDDEYLKTLASDEISFDHGFIKEIIEAKKIFNNHKLFAVSDHDFHKTSLPESNCNFSQYGLSVESLVDSIKEYENGIPAKTIICHLGAKISVTALLNGRSVDTTTQHNFIEDQNFFDIKTMQEKAFKGSEAAKLAIRSYVFSILKRVTEMISVTKGIDCLVFTGTAGFRSDFLRELVLDELKWLGIKYDLSRNMNNNLDSEYFHIESPDSTTKVIVADTNEMRQIAKKTLLGI